MTNNTRDDTARDGLVKRAKAKLTRLLIDPGRKSILLTRGEAEALLAHIETLEAKHAEDVKRIADAKRILSMWHGEATEHIKYGGGVANAWLTKPIEHTADWLARNPPSPRGTFACPICGKDTPHRHDSEDVKRNGELEEVEMAAGFLLSAVESQLEEVPHDAWDAKTKRLRAYATDLRAALNKGSK